MTTRVRSSIFEMIHEKKKKKKKNGRRSCAHKIRNALNRYYAAQNYNFRKAKKVVENCLAINPRSRPNLQNLMIVKKFAKFQNDS